MDSSQLRATAKARHEADLAAMEEELNAQKARATFDDPEQAAKGKRRVAAIEKAIAAKKKAGPTPVDTGDDDSDA